MPDQEARQMWHGALRGHAAELIQDAPAPRFEHRENIVPTVEHGDVEEVIPTTSKDLGRVRSLGRQRYVIQTFSVHIRQRTQLTLDIPDAVGTQERAG
ncbi:hypothetical protein ACWEV4_23100 [Streptomyces sp. NPDC003860]